MTDYDRSYDKAQDEKLTQFQWGVDRGELTNSIALLEMEVERLNKKVKKLKKRNKKLTNKSKLYETLSLNPRIPT